MLQSHEIKKKSVQGAISFIIRTLTLQGIAFVATVLLGYYLSPQEFGIYFIVTSVVSIFTFLSDVGLAAALVQKHEEPTLEELRTSFTVQQGLAIFIMLTVFILTPVWSSYHNLDRNGLYLLYALAFSFVLASLKTIPSILLERKLEFGKVVIPQVIENIVFYGIAVVLASRGFGVMSYAYAVVFRGIVGAITIYILQPWSIGLGFSREAFANLRKFGLKFQANDLLARLKDDLLVVVLGLFLPTYQMGLLSWAKRWSMFPYQLSVQSVLSVMFSTLSRLQKEPKLMKRAIEKSIFFIALGIFPILAGLCVMAFPMTQVIPKYEKWQPALLSLYLFCINIGFAALANPMIHALNAMGKVGTTLKLMVVWTIITWISTPLLALTIGFHGVALASVITAASSLVTWFYLRKDVHIELFEQIWRQLVATGMMVMGVLFLWKFVSASIFSIAFLSGVGAMIYIAVMLLVGYKKVLLEISSMKKLL